MSRPTDSEIETMLSISKTQQAVTRAPDYWQGVEDALRWMLGEQMAVFEIHVLAAQQRAGKA